MFFKINNLGSLLTFCKTLLEKFYIYMNFDYLDCDQIKNYYKHRLTFMTSVFYFYK